MSEHCYCCGFMGIDKVRLFVKRPFIEFFDYKLKEDSGWCNELHSVGLSIPELTLTVIKRFSLSPQCQYGICQLMYRKASAFWQ